MQSPGCPTPSWPLTNDSAQQGDNILPSGRASRPATRIRAPRLVSSGDSIGQYEQRPRPDTPITIVPVDVSRRSSWSSLTTAEQNLRTHINTVQSTRPRLHTLSAPDLSNAATLRDSIDTRLIQAQRGRPRSSSLPFNSRLESNVHAHAALNSHPIIGPENPPMSVWASYDPLPIPPKSVKRQSRPGLHRAATTSSTTLPEAGDSTTTIIPDRYTRRPASKRLKELRPPPKAFGSSGVNPAWTPLRSASSRVQVPSADAIDRSAAGLSVIYSASTSPEIACAQFPYQYPREAPVPEGLHNPPTPYNSPVYPMMSQPWASTEPKRIIACSLLLFSALLGFTALTVSLTYPYAILTAAPFVPIALLAPRTVSHFGSMFLLAVALLISGFDPLGLQVFGSLLSGIAIAFLQTSNLLLLPSLAKTPLRRSAVFGAFCAVLAMGLPLGFLIQGGFSSAGHRHSAPWILSALFTVLLAPSGFLFAHPTAYKMPRLSHIIAFSAAGVGFALLLIPIWVAPIISVDHSRRSYGWTQVYDPLLLFVGILILAFLVMLLRVPVFGDPTLTSRAAWFGAAGSSQLGSELGGASFYSLITPLSTTLPAFALTLLTCVIFGIGTVAYISINEATLSDVRSAVQLLPILICSLPPAVLVSLLARTPFARGISITVGSAAILAASICIVSQPASSRSDYWSYQFPWAFLTGIGMGSTLPGCLLIIAHAQYPPSEHGRVETIEPTPEGLGDVFSQKLLGTRLATFLGSVMVGLAFGSGVAINLVRDGYDSVWWVALGFAICASLVRVLSGVWRLQESKRKETRYSERSTAWSSSGKTLQSQHASTHATDIDGQSRRKLEGRMKQSVSLEAPRTPVGTVEFPEHYVPKHGLGNSRKDSGVGESWPLAV